jgi:Amt family ammonium transporter
LVAVSGACALVDGWAACVIGVVGAGAYHFGSWLLLRLRIDDPLDASPLHFCCGLLGVVSVGLFSKLEYLEVSGIHVHPCQAVVHEKHALR